MRNSPNYIAHQLRPRSGNRQALFLVRYADATSTTIRVSPGIAVFGPSRLSAVAAERQARREPAGGVTRLFTSQSGPCTTRALPPPLVPSSASRLSGEALWAVRG